MSADWPLATLLTAANSPALLQPDLAATCPNRLKALCHINKLTGKTNNEKETKYNETERVGNLAFV